VVVYDPKVPAEEVQRDVLGVGVENPHLIVAKSAKEAAEGAHALAVLTEWDEFKTLDFPKIYAGMHKPAFAFDGRNILPRDEMQNIGFRVFAIGKPSAA
jgi:UDPglucose 6-dehydrogenase